MSKTSSLGNRLIALMLSIIMVLGMVPMNAIALESTAVAQINDVTYDTLADAIAAVPTGTNQVAPTEATTIKLLRDTAYAFDVGISTGATTMNLKLDLNGKTLTLAPSVGSVGTKANGIRVLAYSKLEIVNGTILCSNETADNVKVGIANYGTLTLDSVSVKAGSLTQYTVNNRGALTLKGNTEITGGSICAVTNDPYNLYYTSAVNASVTCNSSDVMVESMLVERYERDSANDGVVELNISAGYFGKIVEDGASAVGTAYNVTGGIFGVSTTEELQHVVGMIKPGDEYECPSKPVTIKLLSDISGSFDVGTSNGKAPKNILLDMNGKTLTLKPGIGSDGTEVNGIRVLAYSKLAVQNGTIKCSDEDADKIKVGIANYSDLTLTDVKVNKGSNTIYTVNNRGALTLNGATEIQSGSQFAITNDPYNLYYTSNVNASVTSNSASVVVESMQVERYARNSQNQGKVELNISAGYFGKIVEDGESTVGTSYNVTGGTIGVSTTEELKFAVGLVKAGNEYEYPTSPVTIKLLSDISGSFNVGTSNGKAPKNIVLDMNNKTLTLKPGVGSDGTETSGIRVLAYSKLEILNGTIKCSDDSADKIKVGIANYSDLTLNNVEVKSGDLTIYTINNRGNLTLQGETTVENGKVPQSDYTDSTDYVAITNDPYNLYYKEPINAVINCNDSKVNVGNIQLETYGSKGNIELNIRNGSFGGVYQPAANGTVAVNGAITGGSFNNDVSDYCADNYSSVLVDGKYTTQFVKNDQTEFKFADSNSVEITYNDNSNKFLNVAQNGKGIVAYSVVSEKDVNGNDADVVTIDSQTGELTILKAGTVQVKASATGDDLHNAAEIIYTLTIKRAEQEGFAFVEPNPVDKWVGENYTNTASGGQGTGAVTYAITDGADVADIDAITGKLTFKKVGTVQVSATKAADDTYAEAKATYTVKSIKYPQAEFKFANSNPSIAVGFAAGSYTNVADGGSGEGAVTYSIIAGNQFATIDENTGKITFIKAGEVTVVAKKAADANYNETMVVYTLSIEQSAQEALVLSASVPNSVVYRPNAQNLFSVSGGSGTGKISYAIVDGNEFAVIDSETGEVTTLRAGGSFTVQVEKAGDDGYLQASSNSVVVYVDYAQQTGFEFASKTPANVVFNDNGNKFANPANGGQSTGLITYAFADAASDSIADIDSVTGEITIQASGTIQVVATKAGDDRYNQIEDTYTLKVEKDIPEFTVGNVDLVYGVTEYKINVNTTLGGTGKYLYSIEGANNIGASVDENGIVTFENSVGKVGTIAIKVKKEADNQYIEAEKTFTLTVSYHQPSEQPTVTGNTINASGWYTGIVTIHAPKGYQISYANELTGTTWSDTVTVDTEGDHGKNVYLKKGNEITNAISFDSIKIDTAAPVNVDIQYENTFWETFLASVSFGIYQADQVAVSLTATDLTSGVDYITYNIGGQDIVVSSADFTKNENGIVTYEFKIPAQFRNTITMQATDVAGWTSGLTESEHTLVVDTVSPILNVKYDFVGSQNIGDVIYSNDNVTVKFEISESNFELRSSDPVFKVNDTDVVLTWTYDDATKLWKAEHLLSGDNSYNLSLTFTDASGNVVELTDGSNQYVKKIIIDSADPKFTVTYDNDEARNDNNYKANRVATIKVKEHNFKAEEVVLVVTAKDITGTPVDISAKGYAEYAKNAANWTQDGDVWTLKTDGMKFDIDAIYNITLNYTDLAENAAATYETEFVVDKTIAAESDVTIEYSNSVVDKILETVTFGFYQGPVQVKVTVKDQTAGVEYFEITYTQADGKNNSNKATYTTEKLTAVQDENDKTVFTATHIIDAQARGTVSVNLIDKAGNTTGRSEEYVIVTDTIAPGLEYQWTFTDDQVREYNNIYYTKEETKVKFTITEANFDLSLKQATGPAGQEETAAPAPVLTVNGVAQNVTWTQIDGTDKWETEITLTGNGDYVVELSYTDRSTNAMDTYTKEVHIDNVAPEFEVTYDNNEARNDNNYKADRVATIKVKEHNFKAEEVVLVVTAKDITGTPVDISAKGYAEYAKNAANWTQDGDVWTLKTDGMKFDIDAIYNITLNYTDLAENAAATYETEFVVDKTIAAESDVTIEYSNSVVDKILETVTFGFYQGPVQVKVTVKDQTAGVEYFEITYTQADGKNNSNKATYTTEKLTAVQDENDKTVFTATHIIDAQARGTVSVNLIDKAGNTTGRSEEYVIVTDTIAPGLEYQWTFTDDQVREYNNIYYTKEETKVKFTITEANFDLSLKQATGPAGQEETAAPAPVLTVNGVAQNVTWTQIDGTDKWETEITLTGNGDYVVELSYTDRSTNTMDTYTKEVHIDNVAPKFEVTFDNNEARNDNNYKADRVATIKVTEHNFKAEEVDLDVVALDIIGEEVDISSKEYKAYAKNSGNWMYMNAEGELVSDVALAVDPDEHYVVIPKFDIDANYKFTLNYTDLAENEADQYEIEFVVDHEAPTGTMTVEYKTPVIEKVLSAVTFGYYKPSVTVVVTASDITSGVDYINWTYNREKNVSTDKNVETERGVLTTDMLTYSKDGEVATGEFTLTADDAKQYRGNITLTSTDRAGNTSAEYEDVAYISVVDTIDPKRIVAFSNARVLDKATMTDVDTYAEGDAVILYYENKAEVTITVNEANFYSEDVVVTLTKNGTDSTPVVEWTDESADKHVGKFTITGDGDYFVKVTYTDRSGNLMAAYSSREIRIDNTDPTISVRYEPEKANANGKYFNADRKAIITIVDHNFLADDVVAKVTAVDVQGNKIANADAICAEFATYLKTRSSWSPDGDVHTAEIIFDDDAQYTFQIDYKDIVGNTAETYVADPFVVDHVKPTNPKIEYSESIVDKIFESITFGFYEPKVTVTITADDITSGVDYFDWTYTKEPGTSDVNAENLGGTITSKDIEYSNGGLTAKATFTIPADARGYITAYATDRAGNSTSETDKDNITVVVDDRDPIVKVTYEANSTDTKVQFTDDKYVTVDTFAEATYAYYNGDVKATIVINEANFFEGITAIDKLTNTPEVIHNVGIKLTKTDDNGNKSVYEYLPTGAVQKYEGATPIYITWNTTGDEHSFSIDYADNADYVLEIEYTDLSTNDASISANDGNTATKSYTSKVVTVDKIAPVVDVEYSNKNVIHTIDGRDYFAAEQTATITVEEHNFRADDFAATVVAQNIVKANVDVEDFKATLSDDSKWDQNGNTYTITITYSVDANYSFDFEYADLAQNAAAEYTEDLFTVDTTAPKNLTVSYSTSVIDKILGAITFGYYNGETTVTITAEDDTAGIYYFVYSYLKSEGVSAVNAELINDKIEDANSRIVQNGKKFTTSFTIPKKLLTGENQFNGTVKFTAFDRSENNTEKVDNRRVIVDNIAPTATITYNQPVQNANNISYYAGDINAKIVVNEANFYSEDVVVTVKKDGANYPVNVKWVDDSVDVHTGTFTLTADGDYTVTIDYKDRSDNQMVKYTSNRLTLDTKAPSVRVSNIKHNSANKDEVYGFTITANDVNLDASSFKPVLTAIVRNDDGSYETKTVSLGDMKTVESGKTYTFTVDNLEEDAVYTLVCTLKDMSGNQYSKMVLSDNASYDEVRFSINRNGSTFAVDKDTDTLVNQYYVYSVDQNVVIEEVNVDPVETYVVKLNGERLIEGNDYTTTVSNKTGEWSKRTYSISKDLFETEGEYSIVIESTDKAETTAYSDVKNLNVSFVVDQTAPVLTISGLENGGRYQVEEQTVTIIPTDDGGRLNSIKVVVLNSNGEPLKDASGMDISVRFEMSGEEFLTYLAENGGKVTFTVPEGLENQVQIICNDCAVDANGKTNEFYEVFTKVTVSQSEWIIFYANKPLFYGVIAGIALLAGGITGLIFFLKKKKASKK